MRVTSVQPEPQFVLEAEDASRDTSGRTSGYRPPSRWTFARNTPGGSRLARYGRAIASRTRRLLGLLSATLIAAALVGVALGGPAFAATGYVGGHRDNGGMCWDGGSSLTRVEAPFVKSATGGWQWVSYRPILWRLSSASGQWEVSALGPQIFGQTSSYENLIGSAYRFPQVQFHGFYRVSIEYRWYTGNSVTGYDHLWVSSLYTPPPINSYGGLAGGGTQGTSCVY
jgi:hypothetical protein